MFDERRSWIFLWVGVALYAAFYSFVSYLKYAHFVYGDFDLAVHAQVLWNLCHGSAFSSILGIHFLGNHAHLFHFLLVPLYALFPHAMTILILQSCALAAAAVPLYFFARSVLGYRWALLTAVLYLFYPGAGFTNLFEFHPTSLATLFLMAMLTFFQQKRFRAFAVMAFLAMLCQENIPLVVFMMGFWALWEKRRWPWSVFPFVAAAAYFLLATLVIIPHFNNNTIQFIGIYGHLGRNYTEILRTIVLHPLEVVSSMLTPPKLAYMLELLAPLLWIPLAGIGGLFLALPLFLQHLLSARASEISTHLHYTAEMIPFIFAAFVWGIRRIQRIPEEGFLIKRLFVFVGIVGLLASVSLGPLPGMFFGRQEYARDTADEHSDRLLRMVPSDASVVASFRFLPHLVNRRGLYSYHHLYWGYYTLSNLPYRLPGDVSYALIDFSDPKVIHSFYSPTGYQRVSEFLLDGTWGIRDRFDMTVLFNKGFASDQRLFEVSGQPFSCGSAKPLDIDSFMKMEGYDAVQTKDGLMALSFCWASLAAAPHDLFLVLRLTDAKGQIVHESLWPVCYGLYPAFAWRPGEHIKMDMRFLVPSYLARGRYRMALGYMYRDEAGFYESDEPVWTDLTHVVIS